jgi:cell cycle arrest protein BUB3
VTGGWDSESQYWQFDPSSRMLTKKLSLKHAGKVCSLSLVPEKSTIQNENAESPPSRLLLIATINRKLELVRIRCSEGEVTTEVVIVRETAMAYQTRRAVLSPKDSMLCICASIEGRISVEPLDGGSRAQLRTYAFKSHRLPDAENSSSETIYPVNDILVHPEFGTFATCGSDGFVHIWDPHARKRLATFGRYQAGVSCIALSCNFCYLAIAASYSYEQGELE